MPRWTARGALALVLFMSHYLNEERDQELNPPPKPYRVTYGIKLSFMIVAMLGVIFYFQSITTKRSAEKQFITKNHLAPQQPQLSDMPKLSVVDVASGATVDLGAHTTWVLLNIWATWCPPCQEEMPELELLQQKLNGKLLVIALSVDDSIDAVKDFKATHNPSFTMLWDNAKRTPAIFGITKYPETFLINPHGQIIYQFSGPKKWASPQALDYLVTIMR